MSIEIVLAFVFGVAFLITLIIIAVFIHNPTPFQDRVFRIVLALSASGIAANLPGFLNIDLNSGKGIVIGAGGAIAVFVIVYFFTPRLMNSSKPVSIQEKGKPFDLNENDDPRWLIEGDASLLIENIKSLPNGHKELLFIIAEADSLKPQDLLEAENVQFTRRELVYICRELTNKKMVSTAHLTDYEYELSPEVKKILGVKAAGIINSTLPKN